MSSQITVPRQHYGVIHMEQSPTSMYLKQYDTPTITATIPGNPPRVISVQDMHEDNITVYSMSQNNPQEKRSWFEFKCYSLWNAIRFAIIAIIVCASNYGNQRHIEQERQYCCDCYYVALNPTHYNIANNRRIDWSYCMPECVDCAYCNRTYNNSANISFATSYEACPAESYTATKTKVFVSSDWDQNCPDNISITTLQFFLKDYRLYGVSTVIIVILYILFMWSFIFCCKAYAGVNSGASLLVYNVMVSINAVYAMFKPLQYIHQEIRNTPYQTFCEVDAISETMEDLITACVSISFVFISFQWIIGVFGCLITRKAIQSNSSKGSVVLPYKIRIAYIQFEKLMIFVAIILAVVFYITLMFASSFVITARLNQGKSQQDAWKIAVIIIVDSLCILSCIDIFFCPFCRQTCTNYCGKIENQNEYQTYRELWGWSIDETNTVNMPFLDETVKQADL